MEKFLLEKYLENSSRKVVTRRGNPVRILCTDRKHGEDDLPIVFLEESNGGEFLLTCRNDGRCDNYDTQYDLFFADEEEELTEFEKTLDIFAYNSKLEASNPNYYDWLLKSTALNLLDLARKELLKDLPKWKKNLLPNIEDCTGFNSENFCYKGYYINYQELFGILPKEE